MAGWHHWFDGHEFEWTPGVGDGPGGLACCDSWGRKESDTTERLSWTELTLGLFWRFTYLAVWPWSSPLTSVFSSGKWAPCWYLNLLDCIRACKEQMALRGLSGFLSLDQLWIILPPGEKEIFCLEVMPTILKVKYWFKPNYIYFWTIIQNSDWADASVFLGPRRANDYCLRLLLSLTLPVSLSLPTTSSLKSTARRVVRLLVSFQFPASPA